MNWYETTSLSYESNQAYGLFQRLIKSVYDVDMNAPLQEFREDSCRFLSQQEKPAKRQFNLSKQFLDLKTGSRSLYRR